jgi:TonB-dependent receptor
MNSSNRMRRVAPLFCGVSLVAAALAMPSTAFAQTSDPEADQAGEDAIVVTGLRASLESAQNIKRSADQIVDSVTAQDIGALPDRSVSEALQRIAGVQLQRTNENRDPARLASEGGAVFIRGLSWVRSETNGRDIFSANSGRGLSFEDVSADLLAGVDVYKNPSAELIEGGIGGIVNLRTRKPLDGPEIFAISGDYNYGDLRGKGWWSVSGVASKRFDTGIGEFGILVSGSLNNIGNRTDSIQAGRYDPTTYNVGTVYSPVSLGWRRIDWEQRRLAFNGSIQWSPSPDLTFTAEAFVASADPKDIENASGFYEFQLPVDSSSTFDAQRVVTGGRLNNAGLSFNTRYGEAHKVTRDFSGNVRWTPGDRWTFSADVQRVSSKAEILSMTAYSQFGVGTDAAAAARRPNLIYDLRGDDPVIRVEENGARLADQGNYWWAAAMDHLEDNSAGEWAERADIEYKFGDDSFLRSFRFGARATQKEATTRQTGYNWAFLSQQFWGGGGGAPVYLDDTGFAGGPQNSALPQQSELFEYSDWFRGSVHLPGNAWFPTRDLVANGTDRAYDFLRSTQSSGWGWTPLTEASYANATPAGDNPVGGITTQREDTLAGYGVLRFGTTGEEGLRFDGNIGIRVIETRNTAEGTRTIAPAPTTPYAACTAVNPVAACEPLRLALAFVGTGTSFSTAPVENNYTDVLPSLNLRFHLNDDLQLRFAAAKAISRPAFYQMVPFTTLGFNFDSTGLVQGGQPYTGSGGNPLLRPIKSNQFDASLEWYFGRASSLTFAAFYKDVSDYIFNGVDTETFTANGQTLNFQVTRNTNGDNGKIKGFEIAYQQFYDFLPGPLSGLGLQANFTFIDSSGGRNTAINVLDTNQTANAGDQTLPLEGLSRTSYNIAGLYEKYGVSARLAYNWREGYLLTTSAANINRPVWSEDYGQLDGSILVNLTKGIKVGVQATNLLNTRTYLDVGGATLKPRYSWTDTDRRVAFLVRGSF